MLYDNFISNLSEKIQREFDKIKVEQNFDLGCEFEVALCKILRNFLPLKYGICRGFVVDQQGKKKGDDIIIYDQERFPTLRQNEKDTFEIKEQIPIEAVYGYIEVKHLLSGDTLEKAIKQIIEVKELCEQREKTKLYQNDPYIDSNLEPPFLIDHLPEYRNPIFTMIFARFSCGQNRRDKSENLEEIDNFLKEEIKSFSTVKYQFYPELIIAGTSNIMFTSFVRDNITKPTLFHLFNRPNSGYQIIKKEKLAFGIAFCHLLAALDFIRLGKMPWENILNETKSLETFKLTSVELV